MYSNQNWEKNMNTVDIFIARYQRGDEREYFEFSSDSCKLSEAKSLLEKKYVYAKDKNLIRAMHLFYSSQSLLYYTDGEEYDNFPELILNKQLKFENFKEYAHEDLKFLLENNYIFYDSNGNISIDYVKSNIMRILFNNEVLSYHYFKKEPNYIEQIDEYGMLHFITRATALIYI